MATANFNGTTHKQTTTTVPAVNDKCANNPLTSSLKAMEQSNAAETAENFQEVKIPVPWGHIAGKWWGPVEQQPVLAVHGWQDNAGTFDELAPYFLSAGLSMLAIDLPGHGLSSPYPQGMYYYIFWDGVQIMRRIIKYYNWTNVQLMGHSLGGIISYIYASAFASEVECIICVDIASPAVRDPLTLIDKIGPTISTFLRYETLSADAQPSYDYDEMVKIAVDGYKGSCTQKAVEILLRRGMRQVGDGKFLFTRDVRLKAIGIGMIGIDESLEMAKRISCRVLNLRANPGIKWEQPEYYDMVLDELERSACVLERHLIDGMHHLHLNDPDCVAPIIVGFLKRKQSTDDE